jgi:hypothetical protein
MTQRTFTGKTGDVWTWEETPEVVPFGFNKKPNDGKETD